MDVVPSLVPALEANPNATSVAAPALCLFSSLANAPENKVEFLWCGADQASVACGCDSNGIAGSVVLHPD